VSLQEPPLNEPIDSSTNTQINPIWKLWFFNVQAQSVSGTVQGAPTNAVTPAAWLQTQINGSTFWIPLYR
jgi:hypothetical protein